MAKATFFSYLGKGRSSEIGSGASPYRSDSFGRRIDASLGQYEVGVDAFIDDEGYVQVLLAARIPNRQPILKNIFNVPPGDVAVIYPHLLAMGFGVPRLVLRNYGEGVNAKQVRRHMLSGNIAELEGYKYHPDFLI